MSSEVKTNTKLIESEIHQFNSTSGRVEEKKKASTHYNIFSTRLRARM